MTQLCACCVQAEEGAHTRETTKKQVKFSTPERDADVEKGRVVESGRRGTSAVAFLSPSSESPSTTASPLRGPVDDEEGGINGISTPSSTWDSDVDTEIGQWGGKRAPFITQQQTAARIATGSAASVVRRTLLAEDGNEGCSSTSSSINGEHEPLFTKQSPFSTAPLGSINSGSNNSTASADDRNSVGISILPCCTRETETKDFQKLSTGNNSEFQVIRGKREGYALSSPTPSSLASETPDREKEREEGWYGSTDQVQKGSQNGGTHDSYQEQGESQPTVVFKESWRQKESRLRRTSPVGHLSGWRLLPVIVKSGDDLRQEQCASQVIFQMHHILKRGRVGCWLRPYGIIATSPDSGLIEAIPDTVSLDVLRRRDARYVSLMDFFERFFGPEGSQPFIKARTNFMRSLAGYCIVCYILQLKDRHNGNILLDTAGHIIHIDFGFMLAKTPGGNMGFEKAPFKLTAEFVDLLNGAHSPLFHKFR